MVLRMSKQMDQYFRDYRILDNVTKRLIQNLTEYVEGFYVAIKHGRLHYAQRMWNKLRE